MFSLYNIDSSTVIQNSITIKNHRAFVQFIIKSLVQSFVYMYLLYAVSMYMQLIFVLKFNIKICFNNCAKQITIVLHSFFKNKMFEI